MKRYVLKGIILIMYAIVVAGCSTTAGIEATGKTGWDNEGKRILEKNVIFTSSGLKGDLQVVEMKSTLANDIMRAQATLKSKDKDTLRFEYRFEWFDSNGLEVGTGTSAWKPLILYGKETKNIQAVAPDPRAREFKLKLREPEE